MRLHYRYGWPMGHLAARLGVPTKIVVNVIRDEDAGVFVGTSDDVRGLVVEADTFEDLVRETRLLIPEFIGPQASQAKDDVVVMRFHDHLCHA